MAGSRMMMPWWAAREIVPMRAADARTLEFAIFHDAHDLGVARILREAKDLDFEKRGSVFGTRDDLDSGGLFDLVGFSGEETLIHAALPADHNRVGWGDFVREDEQMIAELHGIER